MMSSIFIMILACSLLGPAGLCLAVTSRYRYTRITFALVASACAFLMGSLFGTFFGSDILTEILMYLMPTTSGGNL